MRRVGVQGERGHRAPDLAADDGVGTRFAGAEERRGGGTRLHQARDEHEQHPGRDAAPRAPVLVERLIRRARRDRFGLVCRDRFGGPVGVVCVDDHVPLAAPALDLGGDACCSEDEHPITRESLLRRGGYDLRHVGHGPAS